MKKPFTEEEVQILLDATMRIIDSGKTSDNPSSITTEMQFLNMFVENLVYRILSTRLVKDKPVDKQIEDVKTNFSNLKLMMQEAIASGFEKPMQKFSKQHIEYYCTIKPVQEFNNKTFH